MVYALPPFSTNTISDGVKLGCSGIGDVSGGMSGFSLPVHPVKTTQANNTHAMIHRNPYFISQNSSTTFIILIIAHILSTRNPVAAI
jgi:hypothetical protein